MCIYILSTAEGAGKGGDQPEEMRAFRALAPPTLVNESLAPLAAGESGGGAFNGQPRRVPHPRPTQNSSSQAASSYLQTPACIPLHP